MDAGKEVIVEEEDFFNFKDVEVVEPFDKHLPEPYQLTFAPLGFDPSQIDLIKYGTEPQTTWYIIIFGRLSDTSLTTIKTENASLGYRLRDSLEKILELNIEFQEKPYNEMLLYCRKLYYLHRPILYSALSAAIGAAAYMACDGTFKNAMLCASAMFSSSLLGSYILSNVRPSVGVVAGSAVTASAYLLKAHFLDNGNSMGISC